MRLTKAKTGAPLVVCRLPEHPEVERQIQATGLRPGNLTRIIRRAPFWGPLLLESEGRTIALGWRASWGLDVMATANAGSERARDVR